MEYGFHDLEYDVIYVRNGIKYTLNNNSNKMVNLMFWDGMWLTVNVRYSTVIKWKFKRMESII